LPDKSWHLAKKDHNLQARATLLKAPNMFMDWEVTTVFYSALHYVDAFLSTLTPPIHPRGHKYRRKIVSSYLRPIAYEYRKLNALSETARYRRYVVTSSDLALADKWYASIKNLLQTKVK
jgi:hypothetical protein